MPPLPKYRNEPWLQSPLRTPVGEIELAGMLRNVTGIDPTGMRILRRFTLVLMVEGRGYYRDARGTKLELGPGDVVLVFPEIAHAYGPLPGTEWTQIYFVFDGPQFQLWRAQGLLAPEHPVLRLGAVDYWRRRLHEVVKGEPLHRPGAPLRALGRLLHVMTDMIASDAESTRQAGRDVWLEKSLRLLGDRSRDLPRRILAQADRRHARLLRRVSFLESLQGGDRFHAVGLPPAGARALRAGRK